MQKFLCALVLSFTSLGYAENSDPWQTLYYAEHGYVSREGVTANSLRVRLSREITDHLEGFLQAGSEAMAKEFFSSVDPGASYAYASPGIRGSYGPVSLFVEHRLRAYYLSQSTARPGGDSRLTLVYGDFFDRSTGKKQSLFFEPYTEGIFTSADENNWIASGYGRLGYRYRFSPRWYADGLAEPFVAVDSRGHYYNNRAEFKPGIRVGYTTHGFSISATASVVWTTYTSRSFLETNPYLNQPLGFRTLIAVGGTL